MRVATALLLAGLCAGPLRAESGSADVIHMTAVSGTAEAARSELVLPFVRWKGMESVLRYRRIRNYELQDSGSVARTASNVLDFEITRPLSRAVELSLSVENFTNRSFYETMNHTEQSLATGPGERKVIRGFTADPITISAGVTIRLGE